MGVKKTPDGEAGDIVEDENEIGVLQRGVVSGGEEIGVELHRPLPPMGAVGGLDRVRSRRVRFGDEFAHRLDLRRPPPIAAPGGGDRQREGVLGRFLA